jgi:ribosomal silencing factor RsfS
MDDPHQVNTIIALAIRDCRKDEPHQIDLEEAKQMAKCILAALQDARLQVTPIARS